MNEAPANDPAHLALAEALFAARAPQPPFPDRNMPVPTLARAKAGSDGDAQLALLMMELHLGTQLPAPFENAVMIPAWMADEMREVIRRARQSDHPAALFGRQRSRGRHTPWDHAERDATINWVAQSFKYFGHRDYLARTAQLLAKAQVPPPSAENGWSAPAVKDAITAHTRRGTIT